MKRRVWVRFVAVLLTFILFSQSGWGMADAWGTARGEAVRIGERAFPDARFRRYIEEELDLDRDGWLSRKEREQVEALHLKGQEISSLEGLEYFPGLRYLDCEKDHLTELDLKGNPRIEYVQCRDNPLSLIDARDLPELKEISCDPDVVIWRSLLSGDAAEKEEDGMGDGVSGDELPEDTVSKGHLPEDSISQDGIAQDGITQDGIAQDGIAGDEIPGDCISGDGLPDDPVSDPISGDECPEDLISADELPEGFASENVLSENVPSEQDPHPEGPAEECPPESRSRASVSAGDTPTPVPTVFTVTFQSKGGTAVRSQKIIKGGKVKKPADPSRSKYLFAGWYRGGKRYDFTKGVTQNLTLTAKWTKVTVSKARIKKLANTSRGTLHVTYAKVRGARGYQIQVSTDKSFKTKVSKYDAAGTALSIRDRYKGRTYYVRVRAYKLDSRKAKVYGSYSPRKKLKIAKGISQVQPSATAATLTSVSLTSKKTVRVKARVKDHVKSADSYYYLFHLSGTGEKIAKNAVPDAKIKKSTSVTLTTPLDYGTSASKLQSKFILAVKTGKKGDYTAISPSQYISNPGKLASVRYAFPTTATKKGLQVDPRYMKDAVSLGVRHTAYNICLDDLIAAPDQKNSAQGIAYRYNGITYWFNKGIVESIDRTLEEFREKNILVSAILLLRWRDDLSYLIPKSAREPGHGFYALDTSGTKARKHWEAVFTFLAQRYTPKKWIANWILGNEVNNYRDYHYTGSASLEKNVRTYAEAYRLASIAIRSVYEKARVYISLDQTWNHLSGYSNTSRQFLDRFAAYWSSYGKLGNFNIAFHPYPAPLEDPAFWTNSRDLIGKDINTPCISMVNLNVLTNYVKMKWGSGTRIILSEQGFTSSRYGVEVEELQAAAIAYAYYLAEFNNMVDAFILHRHVDHQAEQAVGLSLGLWTHDGSAIPASKGRKKYAWDVFRYMDTPKGKNKTKFALQRIGASSWKTIVPGYTAARF